MTNIREKLVRLHQKGYSDHEIARRTKLSQPTVWAIRRGITKNIMMPTYEAIADCQTATAGEAYR